MTSKMNTTSTQHASIRCKKTVNDTEETAIPDSTTIVEKERADFTLGQDVLLKHKDGRYYLGTVVEVDGIREQCLVKFGDNTQNWSSFKDLAKLSTPEQEDLLCVVCKKSAPKKKHEITVCDKCGRGYHERCHQPEIPPIYKKEGTTWICRRCVENEPHRQRKSVENKNLRKESIRKICSGVDNPSIGSTGISTLPYDLEALTWDTYHRVNMEQIYCYCGGNGEWYTRMLQCGRCRQWFHEKCVGCLQYPLYCADRFYVFVCSICNQGKEFLRRLELKWVDMVHLMLFNLTAYNSKKYYDLDTVIIPYINDNWHALQLPPKIFNVSKSERRDNILSVLTNNRKRFKCGREIKKRTTIWGLRFRLPPPAPCVTLSPVGAVTEEELRERWQGNCKLQFLPLECKENKDGSCNVIVPVDNHMLNLMMGTAYQESNALSDTESPCPSPDAEHEDENKLFNVEYGAGCVKKSVPFSKISLHHRKRMLSLNGRERDKIIRRQKRKVDKDTTKKRNVDGGYTKRLSLDSKNNKNSDSLPLTPPTSVSAPPTPPTSGSSSMGTDIVVEYSENSTGLVQNFQTFKSLNNKLTKSNLSRNNSSTGIDTNLVELNTPCDTSGDETSSKSTLDLIIPPPKDFEGKNNPFLTLLRGHIEDPTKKRRSKDAITLPLPLTAVIPGKPVVRPMKRQLSEKDICIGPNGEVKRRRYRRNRTNQLAAYSTGQPTASKTAAVVPVRPDAKEWGQRHSRSSLQQSGSSQIGSCVDYALNGRRLRQRQEKSVEKEKASSPTTPKASPVKQEPDISMDDLKSSVNIYFGAANRIAAGERFNIKAKRIGPAGKIEYLIEWDGPSNGMT